MNTITVVAANLALLLLVLLYVLPRSRGRFQRFLVAIVGAFVGSLVGRMLIDPSGVGHLFFVTGGACLFALVDVFRSDDGRRRRFGGGSRPA